MLIDSVKMIGGAIDDGVIEKGNSLPPAVQSKQGQLFYLAQTAGSKVAGLYVFNGVEWTSGTNNGGNSGGGGDAKVAEPDSVVYDYNDDGEIITVTETYGENDKVYTYLYNDDGNVYEVQSVFMGVTRTETYTFDSDNNIIGMTATVS